jgi:hypothetical protein
VSYVGFVVALAADVGTAKYERPSRILRTRREWLIVSRWGADGEYLTLSNTRMTPDALSPAPISLAPRSTCLGVLLSDQEDGMVSTFLLVRRLPLGITLAGTFSPADGFVRLHGPIEAMRLTGSARYAHSIGWSKAGLVCGDVPDPPPNARGAAAWHIEAVRRQWDGEFVEPGHPPVPGG